MAKTAAKNEILAFKRMFILDFMVKLFFAVAVIYSAYLIYAVFFNKRQVLDVSALLSAGKDLKLLSPVKENIGKDYRQFLNEVERRDLFASPYIEEETVAPKADRKDLNKIVENLRLVGIRSGAPLKAIIEDKQMSKTFYLGEGDSFLDNVRVEKIGKDSVILNCYGESFEIYL